MASSGVNVLRYSALFSGIGYGLYHQNTINKQTQKNKEEAEVHHKMDLIKQGKAAWINKISPPAGVISDPEDPKFDVEKWINYQVEHAEAK